ncbi:hypothetical protein G6F46_001477 [Rhizopus delemar]|uniref:Uncharacterized protein n=2 Tax=Rhizopus TaxID=4842 RepID=A0A9P6YYX6_9FUNG|nr:hypothetical protein G6F55_003891 [Rhizopus delemar]KAG1545741.1 hypothetical protein G6F51_005293 [Rhizopus arrhizus]KAG1496931.1 hypothetical protein G6F54_006130 [Rhizopus delemar]KAG1518358.1 hypothetical protein G6F53_000649 [Rhizopus delemar]KAG1522691.1 hypothetical protein G6F52_005647 [Rhizopus delemar]
MDFFPLSITFYRSLSYLEAFAMRHNSKQLEQLQADLAAARAEICKLQQENAFLWKQLVQKLTTTVAPPSPSGRIISPIVYFLPRNPPIPSKRPSSPNDTSPPPPKAAKPKCDNFQLNLTTIARQFSSPAESTNFKLSHVPVRNLVRFLIHIGYETELRSQSSKFNITARDDFNPLDLLIICDHILVNGPIDCKVHRARKEFLHQICVALQRFRTPIYNAAANFFVQSGLTDLEDLASYDLAPPYKYRTGHILDHVKS